MSKFVNLQNFVKLVKGVNCKGLRSTVVLMLLVVGIVNAWADSHYYAKLKAVSANSAYGLVYASVGATDAPAYTNSSESGTQDATNDSSQPEKTFHAYALGGRGFKLKSWSKDGSTNSISSEGATAHITARVKTHGTSGSTRTGTVTATFEADPVKYTITYVKPAHAGEEYTISYTSPRNIVSNAFNATTTFNNATMTSSSSNTSITSYPADVITLTATTRTDYFLGWYVGDDKVSGSTTYNPSADAAKTIEARWKEFTPISVTFKAVGAAGTYTVNGSTTVSTSDYVFSDPSHEEATITLVASENSNYYFVGWYVMDGSTKVYLSNNKTFTKTYTSATTVYADYIYFDKPADQMAMFKVGSTEYSTLASAIAAAGSSGTIITIRDGYVIPGSYTIVSGVTLLVPYNSDYTVCGTTVTRVQQASTDPSCYKTLKFPGGTNLTVNGTVVVGGVQNNEGQTTSCIGAPRAHGRLIMEEGATMTFNSNSKLISWGYVTGAGTITAKNGSKVYECIQIRDWKGGTCSSSMEGNSQKVFPVNQYYIQNVEVPITFEYGSEDLVSTSIHVSKSGVEKDGNANNVALISTNSNSNAMFRLSSGAKILRDYDESSDRQVYTIDGTASLDKLNMSLKVTILMFTLGADINSSDYRLPLTNNMTININSGTTTINSDVVICSDAIVNVKSGATAQVSSGKSLVIYDATDWGNYATGRKVAPLTYVPGRTYSNVTTSGRTNSNIKDAKILVNGTMNISGMMYTTKSGADICSDDEQPGTVILGTSVSDSITVYQVTSTNPDYDAKRAAPARLHNASKWYSTPYTGDKACEYLSTTGATGSVTYRNGHWGWIGIWKDYDGTVLKVANTCFESGLSSVTAPSYTTSYSEDCLQYTGTSTTATSTWTATKTAANQEIVYTPIYTSATKTYAVNYDKGSATGASGTLEGGTKTCGVNYTLSSNSIAFTRTGYTYDGWSTNADGSTKNYNLGGSYTTDAALTLYPHWVATNYNVTYNAPTGGNYTIKVGSGTASSATKTAHYGDVITLAATPNTGYHFVSWSTSPSVTITNNQFTMPASNVSVTATFTKDTYMITYAAGNYGSGSLASGTKTYGETATLSSNSTAFTRTGYTYDGWSTNADGSTKNYELGGSYTTNAAVTLYPHWVVKTHKLTWNWNGGSTSSASYTVTNNSLAYGSTITYPANNTMTKTGYTFASWSSSPSGNPTTMPDADLTITAQWTANTYYVRFDKNHANATGTMSNETFTYGTSKALTSNAFSRTGYTFAGWATTTDGPVTYSNGQSVSDLTTTNGATVDLYAKWTVVSPSGLSIASDGDKWDFCAGETMMLTVSGSNIAAEATYQWKKWNGSSWDNIAGATSASYSTTMAGGKAGQYCCTVTNATGYAATSSGVWVRVWQLHLGDDDIDFTYVSGTTGTNTTVALNSDTHYEFKLKDNTGGWFGLNDKTIKTTTNAFALNGTGANVNVTSALAGNYTFTINYSDKDNPTIAVTYPTANQAAGYDIYFDKSVITGWTSESTSDIYLRIGKGSNNKNNVTDSKYWTLVPGTDRFYTIKTLAYDGFEAWQIANNVSYSGDNSIYKVNGTGYEITKATNFQKYVVGSSGVTIVPTTSNNTEDGCTYWNVSKTDGMLKHTATITTPSNGTITIANAAQSLSTTTTTSSIPHRTILTITATPNPGYRCTSLTVNSAAFTSGNTYILSADATIAATFEEEASGSGFYVDIVDVDNSAKTLTLNVSGWGAQGWPYTINGTPYGKDATANPTNHREDDRTLILPYTGEAGSSITITVTRKQGQTVSMHSYTIPREVKSNTNMSTLPANQVLFVKGATLTVDAEATMKNIYVADDAKLVVNNTLKADTVFLRTTPWAAAQLENNGTITAQVCYTRIIKSSSQYYQFGLPLACPLNKVRLSDGTSVTYGSAWLLRSYCESLRATTGVGNNWVTLSGEEIAACVGYEMFSAFDYYREFYFPVNLSGLTNKVAVSHTEGTNDAHEGWNIVVSPLTYNYSNTGADPVTGLKISKLQEDGSYDQDVHTTIEAAVPFSYQAATSGYLYFDDTPLTQKLSAPRRMTEQEEATETEWIHLFVADAEGRGDKTSIFVHPTRFADTYETGIDVAKQSLTASRAIIYSSHAYGDMAFAGVADSLLEQGIALTVYSPSAQELIISMRENEWLNRMEEVWLVDKETGMRVDLLWSDYAFRVPEGTTTGRLFIQGVFRQPQVPTDIQNGNADGEKAKAQKVIINDKIYILVNGRMYDATGKLVNQK